MDIKQRVKLLYLITGSIILLIFISPADISAIIQSPGLKFKNLAIKSFNNGDHENSILYFKRFVQLEPYSSVSHYYLGKAVLFRKDLKSVRNQKDRQRLYKNYRFAAKEIEKSLIISNLLDFDESNIKPSMVEFAEHHFHLALAWQMAGDYERALTHYRKSISLEFRQIMAYYNIASIYEARSYQDKANCYFRLYLREKYSLEIEEGTIEEEFLDDDNPVKNLRCYK